MNDRRTPGAWRRLLGIGSAGLLVVGLSACGGESAATSSACGTETTFSDTEPEVLDELTADTALPILRAETEAETTVAAHGATETEAAAEEPAAEEAAVETDPCAPDPCAEAETEAEPAAEEPAAEEATAEEATTVAEEASADTHAADAAHATDDTHATDAHATDETHAAEGSADTHAAGDTHDTTAPADTHAADETASTDHAAEGHGAVEEPTAATAAPILRAEESPDTEAPAEEEATTETGCGEETAAGSEAETADGHSAGSTGGEPCVATEEAAATEDTEAATEEAAATDDTEAATEDGSHSEDTAAEEPTAETAAPILRSEEPADTEAPAEEEAAAEEETTVPCVPVTPTCVTPAPEATATEETTTEDTEAATEEEAATDDTEAATEAGSHSEDTAAEEPTAETAAPILRSEEPADTEAAAEEEAATEEEAAAEEPAVECLPYGDGDLTFATEIGGQYARGVEIASIALDPSREASPTVVEFATELDATAAADLAAIEAIVAEWDQTVPTNAPELSSVDAAAMQALAVTTGVDFDRLWLRVAAGHLARTAALAQAAARTAVSPDMIAAATAISTTATGHADAMIELLRS